MLPPACKLRLSRSVGSAYQIVRPFHAPSVTSHNFKRFAGHTEAASASEIKTKAHLSSKRCESTRKHKALAQRSGAGARNRLPQSE